VMRFFAFFAVFISHMSVFVNFPAESLVGLAVISTYIRIGDLGVSFFFVLSGFLINYLLEKERVAKGTVSLKSFYARRILRIWPLYFFSIVVILVIGLSTAGNFDFFRIGVDLKEFLTHIFISGNIYRAFFNTHNDMLSVLWSVGVEEQFSMQKTDTLGDTRRYRVIVLRPFLFSQQY
jgi:peptidoglycan/LPS O-acetylase OafA/YrhL